MDVSKLRSAKEIQIQQAKERLEQMDQKFWEEQANKIIDAGVKLKKELTPKNEYQALKASLEYEIAEIRYYGYKDILEHPNDLKIIIEKVMAEIQDREQKIKSLKPYSYFKVVKGIDHPFREDGGAEHEQLKL